MPSTKQILVLAILGGGWYFFTHYRLEGIEQVRVLTRSSRSSGGMADAPPGPATTTDYPDARSPASPSPKLTSQSDRGRLASPAGHSEGLPPRRVGSTQYLLASWQPNIPPRELPSVESVAQRLTQVLLRFDLVALQQLPNISEEELLERLPLPSHGGTGYRVLLGPSYATSAGPRRLGFLYDADRWRSEPGQLQGVADPQRRFFCPPLVGGFVATGMAGARPLQIQLVNVYSPPEAGESLQRWLPPLLESLQRQIPSPQLMLVTGNFGLPDSGLLGGRSIGWEPIITRQSTTPCGRLMQSNWLVQSERTPQFQGVAGVFDFLRQENLTLEEAQKLSQQLPVWLQLDAARQSSRE
jgi:hypothetical protein